MALFGERFSRIYGVSCQMTPEFKKKKGNKPSVDIAKNFSLFARCFREDRWLEERSFYSAFPLYYLSSMQKVSLSNVLAQPVPTWSSAILYLQGRRRISSLSFLCCGVSGLSWVRNFLLWCPSPSSFVWSTFLPPMNSIFVSMWRMGILKKVKFLVR